jgi:protein ImuA
MEGQTNRQGSIAKSKQDTISQLRKEILILQGVKPVAEGNKGTFGLGPVESAFPNGLFPTGNIHEFLIAEPEHAAASAGFLSGLLRVLMQNGSACLWISTCRMLFPASLQAFGIEPDRIIFVDLQRERDVLWAAEEALKCEGLTAVVAELREINFAQSRRLQLVVEKSKVTGFILRTDPDKVTSTACVARWRITPLPSEPEEGMPGVGFPRWTIDLLKVRNGNPGSWKMEWSAGHFKLVAAGFKEDRIEQQFNRNAG